MRGDLSLDLDWLLAGPPDAPALEVSRGAPLSYACLRELVGGVAAALPREVDALGVACASPLAYAVAVLAGLEAGLPVVLRAPGDHAPAPEVGAVAVVTGVDLQARVALVHLDRARGDCDPLLARTALAIATSGSTGAPRLVGLGARGVRANIEAILEYLPLADSRVAITLPLWHAYALVGQLLAGLRAGASAVLLGELREPARLHHALIDARVDGLSSVAAQLAALVRVADGAWSPRFLASAGGPLPRELAVRLQRRFPGARLFDQYGLTEASPRVAAIEAGSPAFARGAVGRPLRGVRVWAERDGRPLGAGEAGELWVSGPSLMLGYLGAPAETAARLRGHALRTGDRGYVDEDGYVYVLDREDELVNVGGERISLAAVARSLCAVDGVTDAFAQSVGEGEHGATLVAVLASSQPAADVIRRARAAARATLRPAQRPARYVVVPDLPRLASHKPDRAALRALAIAEGERQRAALREILEAHAALPADDAAPLALDSLALVMLVEELERAYGVEVTAEDIRAGRLGSVAAIAELVRSDG